MCRRKILLFFLFFYNCLRIYCSRKSFIPPKKKNSKKEKGINFIVSNVWSVNLFVFVFEKWLYRLSAFLSTGLPSKCLQSLVRTGLKDLWGEKLWILREERNMQRESFRNFTNNLMKSIAYEINIGHLLYVATFTTTTHKPIDYNVTLLLLIIAFFGHRCTLFTNVETIQKHN